MKSYSSLLLLSMMITLSFALYDDDSKVIKLTKDNFKQLVLDSGEPWLVEFFAPWCGHCKQLQPDWNKLPHQADIQIAKVYATAQTALSKRFNVESYPTIYFFPAGNKKDIHKKYEGERNLEAFLKYIKEQKTVDDQSIVTDVIQITSDEKLNQICTTLCVLGFLPNEKKEQEDAIQILKKAQLSLTGRANLGWFIGQQFDDFEAELSVIGEGYPQVVAVDLNTKKYFRFIKQLTVDNLNEFVRGVIKNRIWLVILKFTQIKYLKIRFVIYICDIYINKYQQLLNSFKYESH